jgi:hypothetical protein
MSSINSQLQPGEQVLVRINRGRKWYHFLGLIIEFFILVPITFWLLLYLLMPMLGPLVSEEIALLMVLGLFGLIGLLLLLDFIHFWVDDVALTDRRILGTAQGSAVFSFKKIEIPLVAVASARASGGFISPGLEILRKDGKPALFLRNLDGNKKFVDKLAELIAPKG